MFPIKFEIEKIKINFIKKIVPMHMLHYIVYTFKRKIQKTKLFRFVRLLENLDFYFQLYIIYTVISVRRRIQSEKIAFRLIIKSIYYRRHEKKKV